MKGWSMGFLMRRSRLAVHILTFSEYPCLAAELTSITVPVTPAPASLVSRDLFHRMENSRASFEVAKFTNAIPLVVPVSKVVGM
mmetsp:Transcript_39687/g.106495  ORF Transcript_39687/g.106495 Transcript_39687/m.106495 type:complete len:84 (-) Transcript_39687:41-292(-)